MVYTIDELPDDIISHIISFLTVRDGFRARESSFGWLHLPDSRSVLQFDSLSVFGTDGWYGDSPAVQSKFVRIVGCFMQIWAGERINSLFVKFPLAKEHASHIDRWIATCVGMEVEEMELDFSGICISQEQEQEQEKYVFPSHLIWGYGNAPCLKRLCLKGCTLSLPSECESWVSNLTTLDLSGVPLRETGMDLILSAGSNLVSLGLYSCDLPNYTRIDGQLLRLKKLTIHDSLSEVKLNCPVLEVFEYEGFTRSMVFVHVPVLRKAKLWSTLKPGWFDHVTRHVPHLEALSLKIGTEVQPQSSTLARSSLKQLDIYLRFGFDLLSITRLLNACPFLETFQLKVYGRTGITGTEKRGYRNRCHFKLKQVKIETVYNKWNEMELAMYLLRNAVALEQMIVDVPERCKLSEEVKSLQQLQTEINPTAKVIIL